VSHQITPNFSLGWNSYYKSAKDLLDEGQFGQALVSRRSTIAAAKVYGAES